MTSARMFQRRGSAAQWTSKNPVLGVGEFGVEEDTDAFKIGDGTTAWNALAYAGGGSSGGGAVESRALPTWAGDPAERTGPFDAARSVYNWKPDNTARLRAGIGRALSGGELHMVSMSDSLGLGYNGTTTIEREAFPRRALTALSALTGGPIGGTGLVPAGVETDRWTGTGTTDRTLYMGFLTMYAGSTATYTSERAGTSVEVYYSNLSSGFSFTVDGGASQSVTTNGTATLGKFTLSGLSNAVHTIVVTAPSNYVFLSAVDIAAPSGLVMHNLAFGGSTAANGGPATSWTNTSSHTSINTALKGSLDISGVSPDLLLICLGANDKFTGASDSVALGGLQTMRNWYPDADCLLIQAWCNPATSQAAYDVYIQGKYALADTLDVPLLDWQARTGTIAEATARGVVSGDGVHPTSGQNIEWGQSLGGLLAT